MKQYFVISDIHSFYDEMIDGLATAGFDRMNPDHVLVVLGDIFDRGPKPIETFNYLYEMPDDRIVMVMGNHELLLKELLNKEVPEAFEFVNGTVDTVFALAGMKLNWSERFNFEYQVAHPHIEKLEQKYIDIWTAARHKAKAHPVIKWIKTWKMYFEVGNYVMVHSSVPNSYNWRTEPFLMWEKSMWGCPFKMPLPSNRIVICGHWHTSDFYKHFNAPLPRGLIKGDVVNDIYFGDRIVGIDGGVYQTATGQLIHKQNVLIMSGDGSEVRDGNPTIYQYK